LQGLELEQREYLPIAYMFKNNRKELSILLVISERENCSQYEMQTANYGKCRLQSRGKM